MTIRLMKVTFLLCAIFLNFALNAGEETAESLASRINFVNKLITESSAARRVATSDNKEAKQLQSEAVLYYQAAVDARAAGDIQIASDRLADAIRSMYAAVGAVGNDQQRIARDNREYEERILSIDALMSAHERITDEKGQKSVHEDLRLAVADDIAAAAKFHRDGMAEEARVHEDAAYQAVILAVEKLRHGETLVRQLNFASDEEEYLYELDRNDTHEMLFNLLVGSANARPGSKEQSEARVAAAGELRRKAEDLAGDGNFDDAITLLEQSTSELVKAIRGAGVYIPG